MCFVLLKKFCQYHVYTCSLWMYKSPCDFISSHWNCCNFFFSFVSLHVKKKKDKEPYRALVPACTARSPSGTWQSERLSFLHFWQIRLVFTAVCFSWYEKAFSSLVRTSSFTVLCSCCCQVTSDISSRSLLPHVNILYAICTSTSTNFSCCLELQATGHFQSKMLHLKIKLSTNW